jgi:CHAT domain-containing protein
MDSLRALRYAAVSLLSFNAAAIAAVDCAPAANPKIQSLDFAIARDTRVARTVDIPAGAVIVIEAFEIGIHTRLEVSEPAAAARTADTPLNRWGAKRLIVESGTARTVEVAIIGLERTVGTAHVVFRNLRAGDPRCAQYWRALAEADAHYSNGEKITSGLVDADDGAANRAYDLAAHAYARAASIEAISRDLDQAQARLAHAVVTLTTTERWQHAADLALDAQTRFGALGNEYGVDRARYFHARALMQRGRHSDSESTSRALFEKARGEFLAVAARHKRRGERYEHAFSLQFAAFTSSYMDRPLEIIDEYRLVLEAYEGLDEPTRKVQTRNNIAQAEFELGRYQQALKHLNAALEDADPVNDPEMYVYILKNVGNAEKTLGRYDSALQRFSQALAMSRRTQNSRQQGFALDGIGSTYQAIGNFTEALAYLQRALEVRPAERTPMERAITLRSIADVLALTGRGEEAIAHREAALRLTQGNFDRARVEIELIADRISVGDLTIAKESLAELLATSNVADPAIRASASLAHARIALAERRFDVATREARAAAERFRSQELVIREFDAVLVQARVACASGSRGEALAHADRALQLAEEIRVSSNNPALRASLWKPLRPAFTFTLALHARAGSCGSAVPADAVAALAIAERSRGRALEDFRRTRALESTAQRQSNARRRELFEQLASRRQQVETLSATNAQTDSRLRILREDITQLRREIDLAGGQASLARGRAENLLPMLRASVAAIPEGTAVVEYWLGEDEAFAWLMTAGRVQLVDLGPAARVESAARAMHGAMQSWTTIDAATRIRAARELHRLIVEPLPAEFARAKTAYFIPDGALHAVPFAVLSSRSGAQPRFLVDSHDVAVAPAFLDIGEDRAPHVLSRTSSALIVADPVYTTSDPRLGTLLASTAAGRENLGPTLRGARSWSRLPATAREAKSIGNLLAPGSVQVMAGFDASRDSLLARNLEGYDILHFAVHAVADTEAPQLSALILSTYDPSGKPRIGEVFAGDLLDKRIDADLVVLSGCETALGHASVGEGLLGLRYAAHAAGARTVIASLWPVLDSAGARLMDDFYDGIIQKQQTPVAALSRAMRNARATWPDPALWGAFDVSIARH